MKTLVTFNIGLTTCNNTRLDVHHALGAIQACGVSITTSAVVNGEWQGKAEQTLFIQGFVADPYAVGFRAQLFLASRLLSQHCIALWVDGKGELFGENPDCYAFDSALFHFHPEGNKGQSEWPFKTAKELQLSECQAIQKEHAERLAAKDYLGEDASLPLNVNGWTKARFCEYLEKTIIPDSKESGFTGYAEDLETALEFIRG